MEVITFADTEDLANQYFSAALAARSRPMPVGSRVPAPRPAEFVRVMATGGGRLNLLIDRPVLTVEAWAGSEEEAVQLVQLLRGLVGAATHHEHGFQVADVASISAPVNMPDPETGHRRYTFNAAVDVSGLPS